MSTDTASSLRVMPVTVTSQTVTKLRDAIMSGFFRPGQRLLEQDLCDWMGVSRTSVREALRRLEAERLITITPNRGPSITEITWTEAQSIYEVRALLEGEAAARFAELATPAQLRAMKVALADFDRAVSVNAPLDRVSATGRFYSIMLEGCGNPIIAEVIQGLVARINFLRARSMSQEGRTRQSAVEMRLIFNALEKRSPSKARQAALDHVKAAANAARESFNSLEVSGGTTDAPPPRSNGRRHKIKEARRQLKSR